MSKKKIVQIKKRSKSILQKFKLNTLQLSKKNLIMQNQYYDPFICTNLGSSQESKDQSQNSELSCSEQISTTFQQDILKDNIIKTKKIKKDQKQQQNKRKRTYGPNSRWTQQDQIKYLRFWVQSAIKFPWFSYSWKNWKINNIFKQMALFISKTDKQCKSHDQTMKKRKLSEYKNRLDLLDIVYIELKKYEEKDPLIKNLLKQFQITCRQQSVHMKLLRQRLNKNEDIQNRINQLYEQFQLEQNIL